MAPARTSAVATIAPTTEPAGERLLSIGEAATRAGVSQRALRYYQEIGLITPSGSTAGGLRRYSEENLRRVARIRELQILLGLNLEEIAVVLRHEDRLAEIRATYHDRRTREHERQAVLNESLAIHEDLRATVEAKRTAIADFLADLDTRIARIHELLG